MINIRKILSILCMCGMSMSLFAQKKDQGYAYFENKGVTDSIHMNVLALAEAQVYVYAKDEGAHWGKRVHLSALDSTKFCTVDSAHVRGLHLLTPKEVIEPDYDLGYDWEKDGTLKDAKATFSKFFVVQKLDPNSYKIIQVVPFIGDVLYAPKKKDGL